MYLCQHVMQCYTRMWRRANHVDPCAAPKGEVLFGCGMDLNKHTRVVGGLKGRGAEGMGFSVERLKREMDQKVK